MFYRKLVCMAVLLHASGVVTTPPWTWLCDNKVCKRYPSLNRRLQSLATCNMFCESGHLWPQPTGRVSFGRAALLVRAEDFSLTVLATPSQQVYDYIKESFELMQQEMTHRQYLNISIQRRAQRLVVVVKVEINGDDGEVRLRLDTDESYKLTLQPSDNYTLVAKIIAQSFCGARHGLETLSQLVWVDVYAGSLAILDYASIEDAPKFHYRGLMLDTARNYFPVSDILRTIDAMGANKLNTFHWHATDSHSFPLQLASVPQLAPAGAYGPGAMYSTEEVRLVARRGRLRGVRVLLEVDAPAHADIFVSRLRNQL